MPSRPLPDLPGVYLARVEGQWEGLPATNLYAFRAVPAPATGTADVAAAQAVADAIAAHYGPLAGAALHTSYTSNLVSVYPLHTPSHPAVTASMSVAGAQPGDPSPAPVSLLIKHVVSRRGRGSQGRTFLSAFPDAAMTSDGKSVTVAFANSVNTAFNAFITNVLADASAAVGSAFLFVQLSKIPPGFTYAVDSSATELKVSTQRRRARR